MFQTKVVEQIKTHFTLNDFFLNRAVYNVLKHKVGADRRQF